MALAVAMGLGRFAFTPLLPMMLNDGVVDLPGASWLASANYLGYMLGLIFCTLQPWLWARFRGLPLLAYSSLVRAGLVATGVLTLAMAWHWTAATGWMIFGVLAFVLTAAVWRTLRGGEERLAALGAPLGSAARTAPAPHGHAEMALLTLAYGLPAPRCPARPGWTCSGPFSGWA